MTTRPSPTWLLVTVALAALPAMAAGQSSPNSASSSLRVAVTFAPRLSLDVSARVLTFHVTESTPADVSIDLAAGVRVPTGTVVELLADVGPLVPGALTIVDGLEGTTPTALTAGAPTVVAKWVGNGVRTGRLTFRLEAAAGVYEVPISLRLIASD